MHKLPILPDGSSFFTASFPLPKNHWVYEDKENVPPAPFRYGTDTIGSIDRKSLVEVAKYAIRTSTMNGKEMDFDPDAMIQNFIIGFLVDILKC